MIDEAPPFDFPPEGAATLSDKDVRTTIHEVYGGIDFWTRAPLAIEDMVLDHVWPRSKNGPDNVFNLVPTTKAVNDAKRDYVDQEAALAVLALIRTCYGPRIVRRLDRLRLVKAERKLGLSRRQRRIWLLSGENAKSRADVACDFLRQATELRLDVVCCTLDPVFFCVIDERVEGVQFPGHRSDAHLVRYIDGLLAHITNINTSGLLDLGGDNCSARAVLERLPNMGATIARNKGRLSRPFGLGSIGRWRCDLANEYASLKERAA